MGIKQNFYQRGSVVCYLSVLPVYLGDVHSLPLTELPTVSHKPGSFTEAGTCSQTTERQGTALWLELNFCPGNINLTR